MEIPPSFSYSFSFSLVSAIKSYRAEIIQNFMSDIVLKNAVNLIFGRVQNILRSGLPIFKDISAANRPRP